MVLQKARARSAEWLRRVRAFPLAYKLNILLFVVLFLSVNSLTAKIAEIEQNTPDNEEIYDKMTAVAVVLGEVSHKIDDFEDNMSSAESDISSLQSDIYSLKNDIYDLQSDVSSLERKLLWQ